LERVKEFLKHDPALGKELCPGIRELELEFGGEGIVIFIARRGNRISLMYVYQEIEVGPIGSKRRELLQFYEKGGSA
jgi:hypothetical protein